MVRAVKIFSRGKVQKPTDTKEEKTLFTKLE
jgi:hypothetical protein